MKIIRHKIVALTLIIIFGNAIIGYGVFLSNQKLYDSQQWVKHSEQIIFQYNKINSLSKDIRIASLSYAITNDSGYIKPLDSMQKKILQYTAKLNELTQDNPIQQKLVDSLDFYVKKRLVFSRLTVSSINGADSAIVLSTKEGKLWSDHIARFNKAIQHKEIILLKERENKSNFSLKVFNYYLIVFYALMVLLAVLYLIITGKYLLQRREKIKRADELAVANIELLFQNNEKEKRADELAVANKELLFQNIEKVKRADELVVANKELIFQNGEKVKRAEELVLANKELIFQNDEKAKRADELAIANKELLFQNQEKEKRADELVIANQELIKEEERKEFDSNNLNALINSTYDLMWSIDTNYKLITSNQPFDDIIKLMSGNKIEKGADVNSLVFFSEQLEQYKIFYSRAFKGESFTTIEYNTEDNWSEISFHPIRKGTEVIGTACHSRDISERKNAELKIITQNSALVKTNAELDRFVYSVSHDLRSPLTSVLGLVSFIEDESREEDILDYAKMIRVSINRLDGFIKNILSYSSNNRTDITIEKIPLQKTITEVIASLRNMPEAKGIHFEVNIEEKQVFYSDSRRFNTIFENLIANAIKYHKKDTSDRYIKISGSSDHENLLLTVADNGIGILPTYQDKIFEMFFRISSETDGSGIGLYIVKEIIEGLEGSVEVRSEPEKGTSFIVRLKNLKYGQKAAI